MPATIVRQHKLALWCCGFLLLLWALAARSSLPSHAASTEFKVIEIVFDPIIEAQANTRLIQLKGWTQPSTVDPQYIADLAAASHGYVQYSIQRVLADAIPQKKDGFQYTDSSYLQCLQDANTCHMPDTVDYAKIFKDYNICDAVLNQGVSELWLWGGPYFGYWEYNVKGPSIQITPENIPQCGSKTVYVMGFSYEREETEMLHDFGHRTEGVLIHEIAHGDWQQNEANDWNRFSLIAAPVSSYSYGHCGNVHYPPNGVTDYDYSNTRVVSSDCDDWQNYPNLSGTFTSINCQAWGCDQRGYLLWWLRRLPHAAGVKQGHLNDWWRYVLDYDNAMLAAAATATPTASPTATRTPTSTASPTPLPSATATPTATPRPSARRATYLPLVSAAPAGGAGIPTPGTN